MYNYIDLKLPKLERTLIDGTRYYLIPPDNKKKFVSITSVTSFFNRYIFEGWRAKVGNKEADRITNAATKRGTNLHSLVENHLLGNPLPEVPEPAPKLFETIKPALLRIGNIYGIEIGMYSEYLGIAGTCDTAADFDDELSIIDYKSSAKPKPREWIENYFVQAAAYACMLYELTGKEVKKLVIIMACENGELVVYEERDIAKYIKLLVKYIKHYVDAHTI